MHVVHDAGRTQGHGSGTVVRAAAGRSWVLTNHHVCPDDGRGITVVHQGKRYPARRVGWDAGLDLCGLEVEANLPPCRVATRPPSRDEPLAQWGHAGASERPIHKEGRALGVSGRRVRGGDMFCTSIDTREGDSGCGVFNARGELVAVCWGRASDHAEEVCVALADVRQFLRLDE